MKKLRIALIGLEHVHTHGLTNDFLRYPELVEFVGMAEVPPYTEAELEKRLEVHRPKKIDLKLWDDYKELLKQDIDIALICTSIGKHASIVEETLALGIHTVVEKPMALKMEDARRMYRAYKKSTAQLIINWPIAWFPGFRKVKELADSGAVGEIHRVQYRSPSTRGPYPLNRFTPEEMSQMWWYKREEGGGSIGDYAGYGCALTAWITGKKAKRVGGFSKNFFLPFSDVEDYSVFTIDFGDSIGLIEGSWSTMSNGQIPTGPVVYGSEGVIVADRFNPAVKVYKTYIPYVPTPDPEEVYETTPIEDNIGLNVLNFLLKGEPLYEVVTPEFNMRVAAIMDAGRRSCESGQIENVEEPFQMY
ncbi:MAG: Gfo/Idh/MocA family oxidoreductase [Lachnospiraceae bacterium]|nr:Gfo/Idh/MocA family oxidoreductase [Lachnospiraceae bacterium]